MHFGNGLNKKSCISFNKMQENKNINEVELLFLE
jgi:hypothetical protein